MEAMRWLALDRMAEGELLALCRPPWINDKNPMQYDFDFGVSTRHIVGVLMVHLIADGLRAHKTRAVRD